MYDHYELMLDRLTDNYNKNPDSIINKMIRLMAEQSNDNERSYELMKLSRDVDHAAGQALDGIGRNVAISRGSMTDEHFRRMIKIKIIANLSNGDIPTLNKVYRAYLGDQFKGIQEGWLSGYEEPAAIVVKVGHNIDLDETKELNEVAAGGVSVNMETEIKGETIRIIGDSYKYDVPLRMCGTFRTASKPGVAIQSIVGIEAKSYHYGVNYPRCGTFQAGKGVR